MTYLWDTNTASASMARAPATLERLRHLGAADDIAVASITRGEVLHGIQRLPAGRRREALTTRAVQLFVGVRCLPVDEGVADAYAQIKTALEKAGTPIGKDNDLWIAAVAVAYACVLVSAQKSFTRVPGLRVEDWTA
ncbi:MAG: PIN domain-containing protein [Armatimonadetes bacterium]|nr:PIN domain-containing protein [Armatimonadota bacterium]